MYIFSHIPKTAGTALSLVFDHGSNRRIFYDYDLYREGLKVQHIDHISDAEIRFVSNHKEFIERKFDFIHGHFCLRKYRPVFPDAEFLICFREPLDRLISHYHHVMDEADDGFWLYREMKSPEFTLADFAQIPYVGDLQSRYMDGMSISDVSHVFINEQLAESIYQFQLLFGFERNDPYMNFAGEDSVPRVNFRESRGKPRVKFRVSEKAAAKRALEDDYEVYQQATRQFEIQKKRSRGT